MSQSSQFSAPADLATHLRFKTERNETLARRASLATVTDAASAHEWVMGFGGAMVRPSFSSSFQFA
jgi:hypothetical protein